MTERRSAPAGQTLTEEDVFELLPWFAIGRTSADETRAIERMLSESPALRAELDLVRREKHAEVESTQAFGDPNPAVFDRVLAQLDGARQFKPIVRDDGAEHPGFLARALGFASAPALRLALVIACLAVIVEGIAILRLATPTTGSFQTASAPDETASGPRVIVRFQADVGIGAAGALIRALDGSIVKGPMPDGAYVIVLPPDSDVDAALAQLRAHGDLVAGADRGS